jgi:undecaprenyl-diphosphatase
VTSVDWALFTLLNGLAGRAPWLDTAIRFVMNDYSVPTALVLVLFALWFASSPASRERNQRAVLTAFASLILGNVIIKAMNVAYYRFRPFAFHDVTLLFYYPSDSSFPSNAAFVGFCAATAIWLFNRKIGLGMYALASLFALSRVAGGVHYPSDIVGGALIGILVARWVGADVAFLDRLWAWAIRQLRRLVLA